MAHGRKGLEPLVIRLEKNRVNATHGFTFCRGLVEAGNQRLREAPPTESLPGNWLEKNMD